MAAAFFLVPMETLWHEAAREYVRFCTIVDHINQIIAAGGNVSGHFAEVGAGWAVVKVAGAQAAIDYLAGQQGIYKFPQRRLDIKQTSLTLAERQMLRDAAAAVGFTTDQVNDMTSATTYGEAVKRFFYRRRRPLGYDVVLGKQAYEADDWVNIGGLLGNRTLGDLPAGQRQALRDVAAAAGRTNEEIDQALGADVNWGGLTLQQVLKFVTTNWTKPVSWSSVAAIFGVDERDIHTSNMTLEELDAEVS